MYCILIGKISDIKYRWVKNSGSPGSVEYMTLGVEVVGIGRTETQGSTYLYPRVFMSEGDFGQGRHKSREGRNQ